MAFQPDILVTALDEPRVSLVVEAKVRMPDFQRTETELKRYMVGMQCPIGMLITPDYMWLYRDSYTSRFPDSVQRVGKYSMKGIWREAPPAQGQQFEVFVQHWLEELAKTPAIELPHDLRDELRNYILPAIASGDVRAAHPRY